MLLICQINDILINVLKIWVCTRRDFMVFIDIHFASNLRAPSKNSCKELHRFITLSVTSTHECVWLFIDTQVQNLVHRLMTSCGNCAYSLYHINKIWERKQDVNEQTCLLFPLPFCLLWLTRIHLFVHE